MKKKHKNGERIRYRMKERTVFLLIIIVAAIRVDKVNKWYSSLPFWKCPSNSLIFCFVSYPRSSSLGLFLHSDFCEELIYIEDTIVLENRALFQAIVLSPLHSVSNFLFCPKTTNSWKAWKWAIYVFFVSKLTFLAVKDSKCLNFRAQIGQKLSFLGFDFSNFRSKSRLLV